MIDLVSGFQSYFLGQFFLLTDWEISNWDTLSLSCRIQSHLVFCAITFSEIWHYAFSSPLDDIIDKLGGPCNVAEMTGRRGRMVRHTPNDVPRYQQRDGDGSNSEVDTLNVREVRSPGD